MPLGLTPLCVPGEGLMEPLGPTDSPRFYPVRTHLQDNADDNYPFSLPLQVLGNSIL